MEKTKRTNKDKSKTFTRVMAGILAGLMLLSVVSTLIFCLVG